jgi:hypothetical protein
MITGDAATEQAKPAACRRNWRREVWFALLPLFEKKR